MKRTLQIFSRIFLLLPVIFLCVQPAFADEYEEQKKYWKTVYDRIDKEYEGKMVFEPLIGPMEATAGFSLWAPEILHIAGGEKFFEGRLEKEEGLAIPHYLGYIIFEPDRTFTFVKKTHLEEGFLAGLRRIEKKQRIASGFLGETLSTKHDDFLITFVMNYLRVAGTVPVKSFPGIYGMGFVPEFKRQYLYAQCIQEKELTCEKIPSFFELANDEKGPQEQPR